MHTQPSNNCNRSTNKQTHPRTTTTTTHNTSKMDPIKVSSYTAARNGNGFCCCCLLTLALICIAQLSNNGDAGGGGGEGGGRLLVAVEAKALTQNQVKFRRLPPKEFSAALGSTITIECEAGASPPPTIHWLKDGKRISQNEIDENQLDDSQPFQVDDVNRIALSATRSRLFIDCAGDQDEAVYTCVAENAFSRIYSHTRLNLIRPAPVAATAGAAPNENDLLASALEEVELAVSSPPGQSSAAAAIKRFADATGSSGSDKASLSAVPQCLSQRDSRATEQPARIHMWTHNIVEIMKNNVLLYCRSNTKRPQAVATSSPQVVASGVVDKSQELVAAESTATNSAIGDDKRTYVSWTLPDDKLVGTDQKDKYEILETGDLLIKDLRWADMGSYVCTVSDDQGSDSVSTFVYPAAVKVSSKRATITPTLASSHNPTTSRLASFR